MPLVRPQHLGIKRALGEAESRGALTRWPAIISYYLPYYLGPWDWTTGARGDAEGWGRDPAEVRGNRGRARPYWSYPPTWEMPAGLINSRDLWSTSGWFTAASLSRIYTTAADRFMEDSAAWSLLPPPPSSPTNHFSLRYPTSFVPYLLHLLFPPRSLSYYCTRTRVRKHARVYSISHGHWLSIYVRIGARRDGNGCRIGGWDGRNEEGREARHTRGQTVAWIAGWKGE